MVKDHTKSSSMEIETVEPKNFELEKNSKEMLSILLVHSAIIKDGNRLEEEIFCPACTGMLVDPRSCMGCDQSYCKSCIEQLQHEHKTCVCGSEIISKSPPKIITKLLEKYRFRCPNTARGCTQELTCDTFTTHIKECGFEPIHCVNELCEDPILRKDIGAHVAVCGFQKVSCNFCEKVFLLCDVGLHKQNCDRAPVKCSGCDALMPQMDLDKHLPICNELSQECVNCGANMRRWELETHSPDKCVHNLYYNISQNIKNEIVSLTALSEHLQKRLEEQEKHLSKRCPTCNKIACEVSQKKCEQCDQNTCVPCSKRHMKSCKLCKSLVCLKCLKGSDACSECLNKRRSTRTDGVKLTKLSQVELIK